MARVTFDVAENIEKVVIVNAIGVIKVARLNIFIETFVVIFKHRFVFTVRLSHQGWYLISGLHKFFMNKVVMFLACAFNLIIHIILLLTFHAFLDLLLPSVLSAFIAEQFVV